MQKVKVSGTRNNYELISFQEEIKAFNSILKSYTMASKQYSDEEVRSAFEKGYQFFKDH